MYMVFSGNTGRLLDGTPQCKGYFLEGRFLVEICRINYESMSKKTLSPAFRMRNAEGAGQSLNGKKTGCRVCAMWAISPQGQPLAYAMLAMHPQGQPLDQFVKPRHAQSHPRRTDPLLASSRRPLSKQRMQRRIYNLCHCVAQLLFWSQ